MPSVLLPEQRPTFAQNYNRVSFAFDHRLNESDLFTIPNLVALSRRLQDRAYFSTAPGTVGAGWKNVGDGRRSLQETLETIAESDSLVLLSHCEKDVEFGSLFKDVMAEVVAQVGDVLRNDVAVARATLVISSPRRVTSYHIDSEVNYLLQLKGDKLLHVFDPRDKAVLTDAELEAFYGGDFDGARYKSDRQDRAHVYALSAGKGVHMPLHAPHWAQNGDALSIGLSLNFNLRSTARPSAVYKVNRRLRNAGLRPLAPGVSPLQDGLKVAAFTGLSLAKTLLGRAPASGRREA